MYLSVTFITWTLQMSSSCRPSNELEQGGHDVPVPVTEGVGVDPNGDSLLDGRDGVQCSFISSADSEW